MEIQVIDLVIKYCIMIIIFYYIAELKTNFIKSFISVIIITLLNLTFIKFNLPISELLIIIVYLLHKNKQKKLLLTKLIISWGIVDLYFNLVSNKLPTYFSYSPLKYILLYLQAIIIICSLTIILKSILKKYNFDYITFKIELYFLLYYLSINIIFNIFFSIKNKKMTIDIVPILLFAQIILVVILISIVKLIIEKNKIQTEKINIENFKNYTKQIEIVNRDMQKFKHDYKNIISSISYYIKNKDIDALEHYFNNNIIPYNDMLNDNFFRINTLKNLEVISLKGLIYNKIISANNKKITFNIDIPYKIDNFYNINEIDICRAIGILLDNAIEENENLKNNKNMTLLISKLNNHILIVVENAISENNINNINDIFYNKLSTKGKNRGLGLINYKEIMNKYDNVFLETNIQNKLLIQKIIINSNN